MLEKRQGRGHGRMSVIVPQRREHLQTATGQVGGARIEQRMMVRKRNVVEDDAIVVFVVGAPPPVGPLHGDDPGGAPPDRVLQLGRLRQLHLRQGHQDDG